jgi:acyl carrier protein
MNPIEHDFVDILLFMGISREEIRNEASFAKDYGFDETQFICLALYIGIFFKVNVKESEYDELVTVGQAINFVKRKLKID